MENNYLYLLRYYQELQLKLNEMDFTSSILFNFREMLKHEEIIEVLSGVDIPLIVREIEKKTNYKQFKKYMDLMREYRDLGWYLNAGNLRNVVSMLYKEEGLTTDAFARKINRSEQEITDLTRNGIVSDELLTVICQYFGIVKSSDFIRYVK